jgi:hypothetical protein
MLVVTIGLLGMMTTKLFMCRPRRARLADSVNVDVSDKSRSYVGGGAGNGVSLLLL